jgi:hypothetical protein
MIRSAILTLGGRFVNEKVPAPPIWLALAGEDRGCNWVPHHNG